MHVILEEKNQKKKMLQVWQRSCDIESHFNTIPCTLQLVSGTVANVEEHKEFFPMPSPPCLSPPISSPASSFIITLTELVTPLPGDTHYSYGLGHLFHSLPSFAYMCRLAGKFWLPEITKLSLPLTMLKNQLIPPPHSLSPVDLPLHHHISLYHFHHQILSMGLDHWQIICYPETGLTPLTSPYTSGAWTSMPLN